MVRRRPFLAGSGTAFLSALAGCTTELPGFGDGEADENVNSVGQYAPAPAAIDEYGSQLQENDHTVWSVDLKNLNSQIDGLSETGQAMFGRELLPRHELTHEDVGIEYDSIDEMFFVGVPEPLFYPVAGRPVDHVGHLVSTVTVGDFEGDAVVDRLGDRFEQDDYGDIARFRDEGLAYAVSDDWFVVGFDPVVEATVDSWRGEVDRHVETDDATGRIVDQLSDTTFYSSTRHDPHEVTDIEAGEFEGQIAEGFGYTLDGDQPLKDGQPLLDGVFVYNDPDVIDEDAIAEWAEEWLMNVGDIDIATDGRTVTITGNVDTDYLKTTTIAFYPFQFAAGSRMSDA